MNVSVTKEDLIVQIADRLPDDAQHPTPPDHLPPGVSDLVAQGHGEVCQPLGHQGAALGDSGHRFRAQCVVVVEFFVKKTAEGSGRDQQRESQIKANLEKLRAS